VDPVPRRGERRQRAKLPHEEDRESIAGWALRHLEWCRRRAFSERTIENRLGELGSFAKWADTRGLVTPAEVTRPALEAYQRHLFHLRTPTERPLSFRSQRGRLTTVRMSFRWLTRSNVILANPASELELPKMEKRLPRDVLTAEEAERVIAIPDIHDPIGLRDRAILEVLYSCGLRRAEVCKLRVVEVDFERHTVFVREGKGRSRSPCPRSRMSTRPSTAKPRTRASPRRSRAARWTPRGRSGRFEGSRWYSGIVPGGATAP